MFKILDLVTAHPIEIVRDDNLAHHEAEPALLCLCGLVNRDDLHHRFSCLGDYKGLSPGSFLDQSREMSSLRDHDFQEVHGIYVFRNRPIVAISFWRMS